MQSVFNYALIVTNVTVLIACVGIARFGFSEGSLQRIARKDICLQMKLY